MKTLVLIACLLTISYAADPQKLKLLYENANICLDKLNESEWTPQVIKCMMQIYELIDDQGVIKKDNLFTVFKNTMSEDNFNKAKESFSKCYDQEYQGQGNNDEKTISVIKCAIQINDLFEKLEMKNKRNYMSSFK